MLKIIGIHDMPKQVYVACSGGVDSMALVDFLVRGYFNVELLFFHHGTENSQSGLEFLREYSKTTGIKLHEGYIIGTKMKDESPEEYWRRERYNFLNQYTDRVVLMGHHLDDCVETWVMSSCHGNPKTIPYRTGNYIRPMLLNRKQQLVDWCVRKNVKWVDDTSNTDNKYNRNFIRNVMMDNVLRINPGIHKVIWKKVFDSIPSDLLSGKKKITVDRRKTVV
jgi:tRNA(Ile)-lysidine synthase